MKIVFLIGNMSNGGGTERVLSVIAGGLSERGHQVSVISLWGQKPSFFPLGKEIDVCWPEGKGRGITVVGQFRRLAGIIKRARPDFLVDVDSILGVYSVFLRKTVPDLRWISWEHFSYQHHFDHNHILRRTVRMLAGRFADTLVVLTDEDKKYYQKHLRPRCKVRCIYDPDPFDMEISDREAEPVILAAGRLSREKGFDLLIRSWELLEERYPDWTLLIVGEGKERQRLEGQVKEAGLKRLRFAGAVHSLEDCYVKASFFVLSSRSEGFGMVLVEAMHFGLPVVCYSCAPGPRKIVVHGENGFLVKPGDVADFAQKMERLILDKELRRRMGESAAESVKRFGREEILSQWEEMLEECHWAEKVLFRL